MTEKDKEIQDLRIELEKLKRELEKAKNNSIPYYELESFLIMLSKEARKFETPEDNAKLAQLYKITDYLKERRGL